MRAKRTTLTGYPMISILELERDLGDEEAFEELETADTIDIEAPVLPQASDDDDDDGTTGVYEIGRFWHAEAVVYWVQRA
ncbi:MAG: hypothetical protein ACKV2T_40850 [Kofleriaceae bacterium]